MFDPNASQGGANRFGIVTRYEVKAIHVGTNDEKMMVGGSVIVRICRASRPKFQQVTYNRQYDNSTTEALLRATANYVNNVEDPNSCVYHFAVSAASL